MSTAQTWVIGMKRTFDRPNSIAILQMQEKFWAIYSRKSLRQKLSPNFLKNYSFYTSKPSKRRGSQVGSAHRKKCRHNYASATHSSLRQD